MDYPPTEGTGARLGWAAFALLVVGVLLALAVLLDLGPFAEDPLREAEFLAQGDEICREAHEDFEKLQARAPTSAEDAADLTDELSAISRVELDRIRDLEAPAALHKALDRYLDAREAGIDRLEAGAKAADAGDAFDYASAQAKVADTQLGRLKLARAVGFETCSTVLFGRDRLADDRQPPLNTDPGAPPTINNPPTGAP